MVFKHVLMDWVGYMLEKRDAFGLSWGKTWEKNFLKGWR